MNNFKQECVNLLNEVIKSNVKYGQVLIEQPVLQQINEYRYMFVVTTTKRSDTYICSPIDGDLDFEGAVNWTMFETNEEDLKCFLED